MRTAIDRFHRRRMLGSLSGEQEIELPNGQKLTLKETGQRLARIERVLLVRWTVWAKLFLSDIEQVKAGALSRAKFDEYWGGAAGLRLKELSNQLAAVPSAWGELRAFASHKGLGLIPAVVVIGVLVLGVGGVTYAVVSRVTEEGILREQRKREEIDATALALKLGRPAPKFGEDPKEEGLLDWLSALIGKSAFVALAASALVYIAWRKSRPAVEYVQQKVKDKRFFGR